MYATIIVTTNGSVNERFWLLKISMLTKSILLIQETLPGELLSFEAIDTVTD